MTEFLHGTHCKDLTLELDRLRQDIMDRQALQFDAEELIERLKEENRQLRNTLKLAGAPTKRRKQ